ncbi:hypothetical protein [Sphingobium sp. CAP-1]|uniref:hypothetical protein n=1 Tax=Sphingobium sp. CAP-1 TaxID=2676077 RepID=UPI0012BB3C9F|nr:hypothetical protein [Sphingobium sp. CAP-1]QGP79590.1 hypothetical protein GL174_11825 [Sphingobium sp. CAP-1]
MSEEAALALMEARIDLKPLRQGAVDSLCGFYAILNAVRLLAYPDKHVHPRDLKELFRRGIAILSSQRHLKFTVSWGLDPDPWNRFFDRLLPEIEDVVGFRVRHHKVFDAKAGLKPSKVARAIRHHINLGRPIVLILGAAYDHWTVIAGSSDNRLQLFDSYGYCWINTRSLTLDMHLRNRAHLLMPEATWAFERLPDPAE